MDITQQVRDLGPQTLAPLIRQALDRDDATPVGWEHRPLYDGLGAAVALSTVHRLTGTARVGGATLPWSLILKVLARPAGPTDATGRPIAGWEREVLTFRSGLLDDLPPGLAAPRCFAIEERPEAIWLWLEDVAEAVGTRWPLARFALAARHLGRFNGRALAARLPPDAPWLSRAVLRGRAERNAAFWEGRVPVRDRALLDRFFPGDLLARARRVWDERYQLLDVLDRLPQTLVHGDADRRNLFARHGANGEDETVAIDWAWTGVAALGEEMVNLVAASAIWFQVAARDLPALAQACLESYAVGLADAGWQGDARLPRIGFAVGTALRYGPFGPFTVMLQHPEMGPAMARATGHGLEERADRMASVQQFAFDQLDAVRGDIAAL